MNALVYHIASGQAFFSGVVLVHLAVAATCFGGRWAGSARTVLACAGLLLIAVSATPLPGWFYAVAGAVSVAWVGVGGLPWRSAGWLRVAVLAVWWVGVGLEWPYHRTPALAPMGDPVLCVVGDSLTAGMGGETETWPRLLAREYRVSVRDLAAAGANVASALRDQAGRVEPGSLVLVEIGGNDVLAGTPLDGFERDLDALLASLRRGGRTVVMLELPLPPFFNRYGSVQRRLAGRHGVRLVPKRVLLGVLTAGGSTLDTIHLSRSGHAAMAGAVWEVVRGAYGVPTSKTGPS